MKLMTKQLKGRFAQIGSQSECKEPIIIAKFFNPTGAGTWYASEYDPKSRTFFGYVSIFGDWNDEWGYFSLDELESFRGKFGLGIERDLYFKEQRASQVIKEQRASQVIKEQRASQVIKEQRASQVIKK